ncbi:MAG: low affinity iron permease family protein [Chryseolinea sp.]
MSYSQKLPREASIIKQQKKKLRLLLFLNPFELNTSERKNLPFSERFSSFVTTSAGSTPAFLFALGLVLVWGITGPMFHYSEEWQMVINTGTTIVTFLMVFLIQKSQNKDSLAIQLKLNELVASHEFASNRLVNVENMTEDELKVIRKYYAQLSDFTKKEESLQQSHSIDEARAAHDFKKEMERELKQAV